MSDFYPHFVQPPSHNPKLPEGKTITTNTTNTVQGVTPPERQTSGYAASAALMLLIGFALITLSLFIPAVLVQLTILGGSIILSANVLAVLSLRELS